MHETHNGIILLATFAHTDYVCLPTLFRVRGKNEGLVVGTRLARDAQAPPRVGPLWIFEGRYTTGRVPGWQTAWGSNGSSHRGRDGHPDSRRVRGVIYTFSERAHEGWRGTVRATWECSPSTLDRSLLTRERRWQLKWSTLCLSLPKDGL